MSLVPFAVLLLLLALNGLYVAAEFAAVSVRRSRIRQKAEQGNRFALALLPTLEDPEGLDRFVAACQVGITLSSLILGAYGQATLGPMLMPLFERWGDMQAAAALSSSAAVVLVSLTTFQMVLGELVPKSLALQYPTQTSLFTIFPLRWSEKLLSWFIVLLNGSGWVLLKAIGVEPRAHRHLHSPEEIRYLVAESRKGGTLRPEEHRRLNRALGLTRRTARELMVPRTRMVAVDVADGLTEAVRVARTLPHTRIPVYEGSADHILGFVHAKDLAATVLAGNPEDDGLEPHIRPILAVHEGVSADRVLSLMREEQGVMAVVVDDFGGTSGILTVEDILAELLGGVGRRSRYGGAAPERLDDGSVRLPGDLGLHETARWVGVEWEGDAETVGGLVMERLGRVPAPGDSLSIDGVPVEVETVEHHAVRSVRAVPLDDRTGGGG